MSNNVALDGGGQYEISQYNASKIWISGTQPGASGQKAATITTSSNTQYIRFGYRNDKGFTNIQLEKGSSATSFSPYFTPIELNKIGNYKDYIFKGKGVNLFDKDSVVIGYVNADGTIQNDAAYNTSDFIPVMEQTSYYKTSTLSPRTKFYDENKTPLNTTTYQDVSIGGSAGTFTTPANACYFRFSFPIATVDKNTIQINEGTTVLPYEPYNAKDKWLLHKEIGKDILTNSSGWSAISDVAYHTYNCALSNIVNRANNTKPYYSNLFKPITTDQRYVDLSFFINAGSRIVVSYDEKATVSDFNSWIKDNNLIVYYVLNTPTTTEITNSELLEDLDSIELLDGLNNIMITSSDLPATLDIHYNYVSGGEVKTSYIDYLVANNILVANTPQGNQAFRITNVDKTRSKIRLQANHIFYDSQNYIIKDSYVVEKNCNEALDHLNNATDSESPFTTLSDVNTIASYRCVRKSLYEAIQVILERWGGHLVRDNFEIKIMDTIGSDNQVVVRYGKNLKNIEAVYDWNAVATKLMPVGADGLLLPEEWLYANNSYEIPYTKVISFDQSNINQEDYADDEAYQQALIDDLRQKGNEYLATNSVPMVNYTLDANLEKISDVGDTIEVIDERLGINLLTHLISFDYNCLLDRYEQLQFGNFTPKLNDLMSTIAESTTQAIEENNAVIKVTLSNELQRATDRIWQALGNSYVIYDGDKILVLDQLPKESAQNVIMINSGGIGFSNTGIDGTFTSAWTIDNILNMENINVINLTADLIKGGILKLGSNLNQYGQLEIYNEANDLIAEMNKDGFKMYGQDGSYILINNQVGLSGYDRNGTRIYWADGDAFHMKKSEVEEEITLCGKMRYIPIQISSGGSITNDGIGLVSVYGGE